MTGMPYQSCLTTIQVLRALPTGVSLTDLEPLLTGSESGQALLNLPGSNEVNYEGVLPLACGTGDRDAEVIVMAQDEPLLAVRAYSADWGLPPNGTSLWLEAMLGEDLLRPAGLWRTTAKRLLEAAKSGASETAAVLADQADGFESMETVLSRGISETAFIAERLDTATPSYTTEGPGFDWAHFTFADLDQVYPPDEDHRLIDCHDGNCGFLHDWPTANPAHTQIALPAPLVAAYRKVMELAGPDPDGLDNELSFRHGITEDGSHWYGLDFYLLHTEQLEPLTRVWMQVDPPTIGSNPFPPSVS
ncbi:hypothetical protein [Catenulispora pinisilvae]|uniref:hypothetical protein n=1 Tax=Catenulispora pinisilvae TaxID=2705253 RepID=UPI001E3D45DB|nr:hypothetical protein [Catenulispora pinisilvae]